MRHRRPVRPIGLLLLVGILAIILSIACENRPSTPTPTTTPQPTATMPSPTPTPIPAPTPTPTLTLQDQLLQELVTVRATATALTATPVPTSEGTLRVPTATATDRAALVALYHATDGPNWFNNSNWLSDRPLGEWHGVTTDGDGRVTELDLQGNGLSGVILAELASLSNLQELWLNDNQLSGAIPTELASLSNLQSLILSFNQLNGPIPAELGSLSNLQSLILSFNQLSGPIPAELGNLANLEHLWLYFNQLSGPIPRELGSLSNLATLNLIGNPNLSEPLPVSLTGLTSLLYLSLDGTELCAPTYDVFQAWLQDIENTSGVISCIPDLAALVALYHATDGPNWLNNSNWLSDRPLDEWHGVTTDSDGRITRLYLYNNQLSGLIPAELGYLGNLQILDVRFNSILSGPLPGSLTGLTFLTTLWLDGTGLCAPTYDTYDVFQTWLQDIESKSGVVNCIPDRDALVALYHATDGPNWLNNSNWLSDRPLDEWHGVTTDSDGRITRLYLYNNQLSGSIPAELGSLANLQRLDLSFNRLSGLIPAELGNLGNLQILDVRFNSILSGPLPRPLTGLTFLTTLSLEGTGLCASTGDGFQTWLQEIESKSGVVNCIPDRAALVALYHATDGPNWANNSNWLSNRPLGEWYGVTADSDGRVTRLHLFDNELSGHIPAELDSLANLRELILAGNELSGPIPVELSSLPILHILSLSRNELSGPIPAELGSLANLTSLRLNDNQLSGSIPAELGNLSSLEALDLGDNRLSGPIPAELGSLSNVQRLWFSYNELSGPIPAELGSLSNVQRLWLDDNRLSGPIPAELGSLANLTSLWLDYNQLSGPIPAELGSLSNLQSLILSFNQLSGPIPAELGSLSNLRGLTFSENQLSGAIPVELGSLSNLEQLYLIRNSNLSGPLPGSLTGLTSLVFLNLDGTGLCAPTNDEFQTWLWGIDNTYGVVNCERSEP